MSYEITGEVTRISEIQTFASGFTKREFIVLTEENYPQSLPLEVQNKKLDALNNISEGDRVTVKFSIRSREYNGRYFVTLVCFAVTPVGKSAPRKSDQYVPPEEELSDDELPF